MSVVLPFPGKGLFSEAMAVLSNSIGPDDANSIVCRPALRSEIEPALRLLLASQTGLGADAQVLDFLSFCVERKIDTNATWIAEKNGQMVWTILPLVQPGRTMLFFTPMVLFEQTSIDAVSLLGDAVCEHYSLRGIKLAQLLIDPADRPIINVYRDAGFHELAELVYLQKSVARRTLVLPSLPSGLTLQSYSPLTHPLFANAIQQSYQQSLDCPALNGLREMDDVIAGHQATGDHDPKLWSVLCRDNHPIATLLLAQLPQGTALELVYLGLAPKARWPGHR